MSNKIIGPACVAYAAVFSGAYAVLAKSLYAEGFDSTTVLIIRAVPAAVFLWVYVIAAGKARLVGPRALLTLAGPGIIGLGLASWTYYQSLFYIPASTAALLLYTYPSLVTGLGLIFLRERLTKGRAVALLLTFLGAVLLVGANDLNGLSLNPTGVLYALGASFASAILVLLTYRATRKYPENLASAYIASFAAGMYLVMKNPLDLAKMPVPSTQIIVLLVVGAVGASLAILFFFSGIRRLGATQSAILMMTEPLTAAALAFLFLGERLVPVQVVGAGMVLAGMVVAQLRPASALRELDAFSALPEEHRG